MLSKFWKNHCIHFHCYSHRKRYLKYRHDAFYRKCFIFFTRGPAVQCPTKIKGWAQSNLAAWRAFVLHVADLGSIPNILSDPEHCQDWSLSSESWMNPGHHQVWPQDKKQTKNKQWKVWNWSKKKTYFQRSIYLTPREKTFWINNIWNGAIYPFMYMLHRLDEKAIIHSYCKIVIE